jgi:outer membrane protein TolC
MRPAVVAALALSLVAQARAEDSLTLDEALAIAARENPDLAIAGADVQATAADRLASIAGVLPRLDLSASFGHDFVDEAAPRPASIPGLPPLNEDAYLSAPEGEAYALSLHLRQTVFDWRTFRDVRRAEWNRVAAERRYDEAALTVAFDVTRRFYEAIRADRVLSVLEKTGARSSDLVARADALFAAGRAPKSDTLQARVNLANDRVAVEAQRVRVVEARTALAEALGRTDAGIIAVPPAALDGPIPSTAEPPPVSDLLAMARARRPTVAAQSALVQAADSAVSSARGDWYPSLSAEASYSRREETLAYRPGEPGVFGDPTRDYTASAQLVLSVNVFEGRLTLANVRRAQASAVRARATQARTELQVAKEIAHARASVTALARQVAIAAEGLSLADQGLALARQRLDAGLASQLEIRDASLKLGQAELSLVQTRIDHAVARANLARAVGGGF